MTVGLENFARNYKHMVEYYITKFGDDLLGSGCTAFREQIPLKYLGQDCERARMAFTADYLPEDVLAFIDGYKKFKKYYINDYIDKIRTGSALEGYFIDIRRRKDKIIKMLFNYCDEGPLASAFIPSLESRLGGEEMDSGLADYKSYLNETLKGIPGGDRKAAAPKTVEEIQQLAEQNKKKAEKGNEMYPDDPVDEDLHRLYPEKAAEVETRDEEYKQRESILRGFEEHNYD